MPSTHKTWILFGVRGTLLTGNIGKIAPKENFHQSVLAASGKPGASVRSHYRHWVSLQAAF